MGKFVNAILRESLRQELKFTKEVAKDEYEYLSLTYNMPVWVIKMWEKHYGKAKTLSLLEYSIKEAPLSVRVNIHKTNKEEILKNSDFVLGKLAKNALTYEGITPTKPGTSAKYYTFSGWTPEITAVTEDTVYTATFTETVIEVTVEGTVPVFSNDGKTVTYGLYPQTHVNDTTLINTLNTLEVSSNGWYLYEDL